METPNLGKGGSMAQGKHPSSRRYPPEVNERAVQLVLTTMQQQGGRHGIITRIARQLDIACPGVARVAWRRAVSQA